MPETITTTTTAEGTTTETVSNRERIAKTVTYFVLSLTALVAIGAIIIISTDVSNNQKFQDFKDVLAILLPLWGTWIGTVLAYYFSKDNFESANKSVQNLVNSITSDKKLESIKAKEVMIPLEKLTYKDYKSETDADNYELKKDFLDWLAEKKISRVIILDNNKCAKYVLHRSIIEGFIAEQYFTTTDGPPPPPPGGANAGGEQEENKDAETEGKSDNIANNEAANPPHNSPPENSSKSPRTLTFGDLRKKGSASVQAILKDGVKFIKEDANLAEAKTLIKNYAICNDVFITKTGLEMEPVLGWITDKTIAENLIVN